jgi:hypothetical protein
MNNISLILGRTTGDPDGMRLVDERGGKLYGDEFKWQNAEIRRATRSEFLAACPGSELATIHRENFVDFLS